MLSTLETEPNAESELPEAVAAEDVALKGLDQLLQTPPFGIQLMEYENDEWNMPFPPSTKKSPAPTFSKKGSVQQKDDGGTGPGDEEATK